MKKNTVRVLSYNVKSGGKVDNTMGCQRVADVIIKTGADVVALQELDNTPCRNNRFDVLAHLASLSAMYPVNSAYDADCDKKYRIGVLTKEKPISWEYIALSGKKEDNSLLVVELSDYVLCCIQLSLQINDQLASVAIINDAVSSFVKPVFLAGSMNSRPSSSVLNAFQKKWIILSDTAKFTFPSDAPNRTIDYVMGYVSDEQNYSVWNTDTFSSKVSLHLPVFVDVRMKTPTENIFRSPVYLQNPSTDSMTVMWLTNVPCHSWVEYGTDSKNMQVAQTFEEGIAIANNTLNRVKLTGLKPGTCYFYRVNSRELMLYQPYRKEFGETATTSIRSFKTFDDNGKDFTALIFNDLHDIYPLFDKLMQYVKNVAFDIVFFNGDCISDVQTEDAAVRTISHFSKGIEGDRIPSVYIRGNHELRGAFSHSLWRLLGKVGGTHSYGAFNIGDTRFVILDCGEDKTDYHRVYYGLNDFTLFRKAQAEFLKKEIASKAFSSAYKRVLMHHIPIYGMRQNAFNPCHDEWSNILTDAPFDVCINAHTHSFNYIVKGMYGNYFPIVTGGGNVNENATAMILKKKGKQMKLIVINTEGKIILELKI